MSKLLFLLNKKIKYLSGTYFSIVEANGRHKTYPYMPASKKMKCSFLLSPWQTIYKIGGKLWQNAEKKRQTKEYKQEKIYQL